MITEERTYIKIEKRSNGSIPLPEDLELKHKEYKYLIDCEGNKYRIHKTRATNLIIIEKEDETGKWKWLNAVM